MHHEANLIIVWTIKEEIQKILQKNIIQNGSNIRADELELDH